MDLAIRKGTQVVQPVLITTGGQTLPLPGGTKAKMQIRTSVESAVVKTELTTENGGLAIDVVAAKVTINITSAVTGAMDFERGVFDLQLIYSSGNEAEQIVQGKVYVFPSVTR